MTYREIAERAHVSVSTVSKALSGNGEIRRELAEEIRRIAFEMGYFKEKSKRRLEYGKGEEVLIAVICPEVISVHYSQMIEAIKRETERRNARISVYIDDFDAQKTNEIMQSISVRSDADGVILLSDLEQDREGRVPAVCFGDPKMAGMDSIAHNTDAIFEEIVRYLKGLGHTQIGYMGEPKTMTKMESFCRAMEAEGLHPKEEYLYVCDKRFEQIGYAGAEEMLARGMHPTAIVAAYDEIALGAMHALEKHGIRVPEEISFVGMNNIPAAEYFHVPLTSVATFLEEDAALAVDLLMERMRDATREYQHLNLQYKLIERSSVRNLKEEL